MNSVFVWTISDVLNIGIIIFLVVGLSIAVSVDALRNWNKKRKKRAGK